MLRLELQYYNMRTCFRYATRARRAKGQRLESGASFASLFLSDQLFKQNASCSEYPAESVPPRIFATGDVSPALIHLACALLFFRL